jgi:hypothetical protein
MRSSGLALAVGAVMAAAGGAAAKVPDRLLPAEVAGYRASGEDGHYDRDTLFELIDGGAEVYRALNLCAARSRRYLTAEGDEILVDVFDMGSPSDAYGAYHHDMREGPSAGVGNESERLGSSIFFWKGRYFVSVVGLRAEPATRAGVAALAEAVARAISDAGAPPALVARLPSRGLVTSQVHYFHSWRLLGRHYDLGPDDLLQLGPATEGVLARYRFGRDGAGGAPLLLVVRYPDPAAAARGHRRLVAAALPGVAPRGAVRSEARGWAAARHAGALVIAVFEAASAEQALELAGAVAREGGAPASGR